jgi:hypothetical protein
MARLAGLTRVILTLARNRAALRAVQIGYPCRFVETAGFVAGSYPVITV